MAMKYLKLYRFPKGETVFQLFKWEYRVAYEYNWSGKWELNQHSQIFRSREEARHWKKTYQRDVCFRNIRIQRRLVQTSWQEYKDTFTYNAKGNGNGR